MNTFLSSLSDILLFSVLTLLVTLFLIVGYFVYNKKNNRTSVLNEKFKDIFFSYMNTTRLKFWYESRYVIPSCLPIAILATLKLIYLVEVEFRTKNNSCNVKKRLYIFSRKDIEYVTLKILNNIPEIKSKTPNAKNLVRVLVAGYGIVHN